MQSNDAQPLVSILVPVYNVSRFIATCAQSLFGQDYPQIEYIFVDDCSPDNSIEVLEHTLLQYPQRKEQVRVIRHKCNRGLSAARNTAVDLATGKYLMHVDSDDFLSTATAVRELVDKAETDGADAVIFDMQDVFPDKRVVKTQNIPLNSTEYSHLLVRRERSVCVWGGLYRTALYKNHGVHAIEGLNFGEDYATKPRLIYHALRLAHLTKPFYCYTHINEDSYTKKSFNPKVIADQKQALSVLTGFFNTIPEADTYADDLRYAATRVRAELLLAWGINGGNAHDLQTIKAMPVYPTDVPLARKYRIAMFLSTLPMLLRIYTKAGLWAKQRV